MLRYPSVIYSFIVSSVPPISWLQFQVRRYCRAWRSYTACSFVPIIYCALFQDVATANFAMSALQGTRLNDRSIMRIDFSRASLFPEGAAGLWSGGKDLCEVDLLKKHWVYLYTIVHCFPIVGARIQRGCFWPAFERGAGRGSASKIKGWLSLVYLFLYTFLPTTC